MYTMYFQANEELVAAKANYEALNAQLLDDLPKLFALSMEIIHDVLCRFFSLQEALYRQALDSLYSCLGVEYDLLH
jgi:BAR domain